MNIDEIDKGRKEERGQGKRRAKAENFVDEITGSLENN